jgi:hypothetical protein
MTTETRRAVTLMLKNKRLGFVNLAEPRSVGKDKNGNPSRPSYGLRVIIDPKDPDVKAIRDAIKEVATTQWKDKAQFQLDNLTAKDRVAFIEREYRSASTGEVHKGFEGSFSLNASAAENKQPKCFDEFGQELDSDGIKRKLYSGAYGHVKVELYPLLREDGNRINCGVLGVMFAGDGEAFGGGTVTTANDFAGLTKASIDAEDLL